MHVHVHVAAGVGTPSYSAPEQLGEGAPPRARTALYGPAADIWPLGLILMELSCVFRTGAAGGHARSGQVLRAGGGWWVA